MKIWWNPNFGLWRLYPINDVWTVSCADDANAKWYIRSKFGVWQVAQVGNQDPTTWVARDFLLRGSYFTTRQDEVFDGVAWYGPEGEDVSEEGRRED